jgi:hypothetical protein
MLRPWSLLGSSLGFAWQARCAKHIIVFWVVLLENKREGRAPNMFAFGHDDGDACLDIAEEAEHQ